MHSTYAGQFYLYQYSVDTVQHGMKETQTLYRFESVKYAEYYLYWDGFTDNVFLRVS